MMRSFGAMVILVLWPALAVCQPPTLSHTLPSAIQPGKTVDVVFHGGNLAGASGIWTSFPSSAELTPGVAENGGRNGN